MTGLWQNSELRCQLNPSVMHAAALLEAVRNDLPAALNLADVQIKECPAHELPHWVEVYAVLNGEEGGHA